jgi:hypothetical protein
MHVACRQQWVGNISECWRAGQGVVQFARDLDGDAAGPPEPQVSLKFYMQPELIRIETVVYTSSALAAAGTLARSARMHLNTCGELRDSSGCPLPPCLAMERGLSLKDWMTRSRLNAGSVATDCKTAIKVRMGTRSATAHVLSYASRASPPITQRA